jgi:hypothetical protein
VKRFRTRQGFETGGLALGVKLLLLLVFVTLTNYGAWSRLETLASSPAKVLGFLALWGISVVALLFIAFSPGASGAAWGCACSRSRVMAAHCRIRLLTQSDLGALPTYRAIARTCLLFTGNVVGHLRTCSAC